MSTSNTERQRSGPVTNHLIVFFQYYQYLVPVCNYVNFFYSSQQIEHLLTLDVRTRVLLVYVLQRQRAAAAAEKAHSLLYQEHPCPQEQLACGLHLKSTVSPIAAVHTDKREAC